MAKKRKKQINSAEELELGQRLKAARKLAGMSQAELAGPIGITFQQIQKYENGTNRVSALRLVKLANILDVDIQYLLGMEKDTSHNIPFLGTEEIKIVKALRMVASPKVRGKIVQLACVLAEDETYNSLRSNTPPHK